MHDTVKSILARFAALDGSNYDVDELQNLPGMCM